MQSISILKLLKNNNMTTQLVGLIILIGLVAGILSGLIGIGGGIVLVPAMVYLLNYTQHQAQGTSLGVLTFPVVILGFLYYYTQLKTTETPIDFRVIGLIAIGFIVGGFIGSNIALRIDVKMMKKIFAIILFYTAFKMMNWDAFLVKWIKGIFS